MFSDVNIQYANFESEKDNPNPDITIYLGEFTPSTQDCYILDDKYYVREDYFYCKEDSYKQAKWKFEITGFESGKITIRISSNLPGSMFISGNVIDPMLHFEINNKGFSIIHASCVSKDNVAYLFSSRSGGGKTTIALNFIEKGFSLLGDNFIILHKGYAFSFLSPLNIFTYNLVPVIKKNLGIKDKVCLVLKELLYKATLGYVKILTKLNPKAIFPKQVVSTSKLGAAFLIMPKREFNINHISKKEFVAHVVMNQKLDIPSFLKYLVEYSYMFPKSKLATHWDWYEENLKKNLPENIPFYKIEVPQRYNKETLERIVELVKWV